MSFLEYPKVIPYTKFEHFGIIRFWVTHRTLVKNALIDPVTLTFQHKTMSLLGYPKFEHFGIIRFELCSRLTEKQPDGADRVSVVNNQDHHLHIPMQVLQDDRNKPWYDDIW